MKPNLGKIRIHCLVTEKKHMATIEKTVKRYCNNVLKHKVQEKVKRQQRKDTQVSTSKESYN